MRFPAKLAFCTGYDETADLKSHYETVAIAYFSPRDPLSLLLNCIFIHDGLAAAEPLACQQDMNSPWFPKPSQAQNKLKPKQT